MERKVDKLGRVHDLIEQDMRFVGRKWRQELYETQVGMENELVKATAGCVHWNKEWHRLRESN